MQDASPRRRRPRITEVAAEAGTSAITVSRVLRDPDKVSPATRLRVQAAVERLGYIPDLSASSLASRRSFMVAVLVPTLANAIFAETVQGVTDAVSPAGLHILLGDYAYSHARERDLLRAVAGRRPDAIVVVGLIRDRGQRDLLRRLGVPVVETWDLTDDPVDMVVGFSNEAVGAAMARHLLDRGRRRLAFCGGPDDRARARAAGFAGALVEAGAAPPLLLTCGPISMAEGRRALRQVVAESPGCDGVFMATDVLAAGALLECQAQGIAVPGRLALAGLGNLEITRELTPTITTVDVSAYGIGARAGEAVVASLRAGPADQRKRITDLGFSILARGST